MMDWKLALTAFATLFLAELGDKTQLAAVALTAKTGNPLPVFVGAATALVSITLLAVVFGEGATKIVPASYLHKGAGGLFILIGALMLWGKI